MANITGTDGGGGSIDDTDSFDDDERDLNKDQSSDSQSDGGSSSSSTSSSDSSGSTTSSSNSYEQDRGIVDRVKDRLNRRSGGGSSSSDSTESSSSDRQTYNDVVSEETKQNTTGGTPGNSQGTGVEDVGSERERQQAQDLERRVIDETAAESRDEVRIERDGDTLRARLSYAARERVAARRLGVDRSDISIRDGEIVAESQRGQDAINEEVGYDPQAARRAEQNKARAARLDVEDDPDQTRRPINTSTPRGLIEQTQFNRRQQSQSSDPVGGINWGDAFDDPIGFLQEGGREREEKLLSPLSKYGEGGRRALDDVNKFLTPGDDVYTEADFSEDVTSALSDNKEGIATAAAAGVVAPEPASTAGGLLTLAGIGAAGLVGDALIKKSEIEIPTEEQSSEVDVPANSQQSTTEIETPNEVLSSFDEIDVPVADESATAEIDIPTQSDTDPLSIRAEQMLIGQQISQELEEDDEQLRQEQTIEDALQEMERSQRQGFGNKPPESYVDIEEPSYPSNYEPVLTFGGETEETSIEEQTAEQTPEQFTETVSNTGTGEFPAVVPGVDDRSDAATGTDVFSGVDTAVDQITATESQSVFDTIFSSPSLTGEMTSPETANPVVTEEVTAEPTANEAIPEYNPSSRSRFDVALNFDGKAESSGPLFTNLSKIFDTGVVQSIEELDDIDKSVDDALDGLNR